MESTRAIAYYRVSTQKQGRSGLGLEAQIAAVRGFLDSRGWNISGEFTEVESGGKNDRAQLQAALKMCRLTNSVLVIAKLDRLSRDAEFLLSLQRGGVRFVCADMPEANELTIHILAVMAEHERKLISQRTKSALAAAKARGVKIGNPRLDEFRNSDTTNANTVRIEKAKAFASDLKEIIEDIQKAGTTTLSGIAKELNARGFRTRRGGDWQAVQVQRVMAV
jgi:DNA invertase Pin-like site-specific DNA recombinase